MRTVYYNVSDSINAAKHRIVLFGDNPWIESNIVYFPRFTMETHGYETGTRMCIESPFVLTLRLIPIYIRIVFFYVLKFPLTKAPAVYIYSNNNTYDIPRIKYCSATSQYN